VSQAEQLYGLQEIDLDLSQKAKALQRVMAQLSNNKALAKTQGELEEHEQALAALEKEQRAEEWGIDDLRAKSAPEEKKLYGGSVKNPKELLNLQQEVESFKTRTREKEDKVLEIMSLAEGLGKRISAKREAVEGLRREWEERRERLLAEQAQLETMIDKRKQDRKALCTKIDPASLELYEFLRVRKQGQTVAKVAQGRCQGCRITLPLNELQQVRIGKNLVQCSTCERILYLDLG